MFMLFKIACLFHIVNCNGSASYTCPRATQLIKLLLHRDETLERIYVTYFLWNIVQTPNIILAVRH